MKLTQLTDPRNATPVGEPLKLDGSCSMEYIRIKAKEYAQGTKANAFSVSSADKSTSWGITEYESPEIQLYKWR